MLAFRELILLSGLNLISGPQRNNFQNRSPHTWVEWACPSRVRTCSCLSTRRPAGALPSTTHQGSLSSVRKHHPLNLQITCFSIQYEQLTKALITARWQPHYEESFKATEADHYFWYGMLTALWNLKEQKKSSKTWLQTKQILATTSVKAKEVLSTKSRASTEKQYCCVRQTCRYLHVWSTISKNLHH